MTWNGPEKGTAKPVNQRWIKPSEEGGGQSSVQPYPPLLGTKSGTLLPEPPPDVEPPEYEGVYDCWGAEYEGAYDCRGAEYDCCVWA